MKRMLSLSILALAATAACAESPQFSSVDANDDGALSLTEFQSVMPTVAITDVNGDGMVNQGELEAVIPELAFVDHGFQGGAALVGEEEYDHIIEVLENADS